MMHNLCDSDTNEFQPLDDFYMITLRISLVESSSGIFDAPRSENRMLKLAGITNEHVCTYDTFNLKLQTRRRDKSHSRELKDRHDHTIYEE